MLGERVPSAGPPVGYQALIRPDLAAKDAVTFLQCSPLRAITAVCRPRPQLFPTNMALRDGRPATGSARALFTLVFQRPVARSFGPADFLVSGLFQAAYLQAMPMPGRAV